MRFLDFDVPPNDPKCDSDGVVVYDPNNKVQKGNRDAAFPIFSEMFLHFLSLSLHNYLRLCYECCFKYKILCVSQYYNFVGTLKCMALCIFKVSFCND